MTAIAIADYAFADMPWSQYDIEYRLHPLDVGFDLRRQGTPVAVRASADPLRVCYPDADGNRRVMEGPQAGVIARLEALGFDVRVIEG